MNKAELTHAVAQSTKLSQTDVATIINATTEQITKALKKGDKVQLVGFGSFEVKKRAARKGVNPKTGEPIQIKAHKTPKFTAGAVLKQAVS